MAGTNPEPATDYSHVASMVDGLTFGPLDSTSVDSAWVAWVESQAQRAAQLAAETGVDEDDPLSSTD